MAQIPANPRSQNWRDRLKELSGFFARTNADGKPEPGKTLWDWMTLLIVPALIAGTLAVYSEANRRNEIASADDRAKQDALQMYLDRMSGLIIKNDLLHSDTNSGITSVAQALTYSILRELDTNRKSIVLGFLSGARLIQGDIPIIQLEKTDLSGIDFSGIDLKGADLAGANLNNANLYSQNLSGTNLSGSNLTLADLHSAVTNQDTKMDQNTTLPDGSKLADDTKLATFGIHQLPTSIPP